MPKSIPVVFKRSILATAILSLSACSSMPPVTDMTLGDVGNGLAKAGKATADAGKRTWNKTTYLLGFSDSPDGEYSEPGANPSDEQLLSADADIDQVLPLNDTPAIKSQDGNRPVLVQKATATDSVPAIQLPAAEASTVEPSLAAAQRKDLIHEVAASETLWEIAKTTTGDANNWHILADVNNLEQNPTVFPGQKLTVPADLVKPGFESSMAAITSADAGVLGNGVDQNISQIESSSTSDSDTKRLTIPAAGVAGKPKVADIRLNAEPFEIEPGETLWDFAKRTTGDATNWKAIAEHNNFTEKQAVTVRPGQSIFVPSDMVNDYRSAAEAALANTPVVTAAVAAKAPIVAAAQPVISVPDAPVANALETAQAIAVEPVSAVEQVAKAATITAPSATDADATNALIATLPSANELQLQSENTLALASQADAATQPSMADETQDIKIVEATYKTDESLAPVTAPENPISGSDVPSEIMVSGTYYPKAVYNNADFSSSLLMRVSPGTTLQVSRAMGTWFEVETDKGVGYVHQRDIR